MKASDVTIGDWVYDTHSYNYNKEKEPIKLSRNEFVELICGCTGNNDLDLGDMYEPVPLTEEILKANGIDVFDNCDLSLPLYTMGIKVVERGVYIKMQFKFVHELQHALRLCGLDELADNFKL